MADNKDTLEARRWFRRRLAELAQQYPHLTTPAAQERLTEALDTLTEEDTTHGTETDREPPRPPEGKRHDR